MQVTPMRAPAANRVYQVRQPDGTLISIKTVGDEYNNGITDRAGRPMVKDPNDGYYKYVSENAKNGCLQQVKCAHTRPNLQLISSHMEVPRVPRSANASTESKREVIGQQPILVLLLNFEDINTTGTQHEWASKFFAESGSSVNAYYKEVSNGKFGFEPAKETFGQENDGIISINLPYEHPKTGAEINQKNIQLAMDGLLLADDYINYNSYDKNGDGILQAQELHIAIIVAGYEASYVDSEASVWAHFWGLDPYYEDLGYTLDLDGVRLLSVQNDGGYIQQGEFHGDHIATIGIICHELGHNLGLPDLYDTDYSSQGIGPYSLMAGGNWLFKEGEESGETPGHLDVWSKIQLGWLEPTEVTQGTYSLYEQSSEKYNVLKIYARPQENSPNEYFLVTNRQFNGFDAGLEVIVQSGGIAIFHVDEGMMCKGPNDIDAHRLIDLEEADAEADGKSCLDEYERRLEISDGLYYVGGKTKFNEYSYPNSVSYTGENTYIDIEVKTTSENVMQVVIERNNITYGK
ncbi:hypothetical protein M9435_002924 [Picochlorum sp. BPE23]|nr:hypothetical protein M9435_002924 [Picochlorum sp. BPE23]